MAIPLVRKKFSLRKLCVSAVISGEGLLNAENAEAQRTQRGIFGGP